jgi:hypothetical protein
MGSIVPVENSVKVVTKLPNFRVMRGNIDLEQAEHNATQVKKPLFQRRLLGYSPIHFSVKEVGRKSMGHTLYTRAFLGLWSLLSPTFRAIFPRWFSSLIKLSSEACPETVSLCSSVAKGNGLRENVQQILLMKKGIEVI